MNVADSARKPWPPVLVLLLSALVLVAIPWGFKLTMAPELGQPCGGGFDCEALDGRCIHGEQGEFCSVTCESDAECPSTGYCGVPPHDLWLRWFSASVMSERFCVPGVRPEQPLPVETARPSFEAAPGRVDGGSPKSSARKPD